MINKKYDNDIVSVIIPTYNSEKYINITLDAVISQTYSYLEIVIVDDCSQDKTWDIIQEYKNKYENIVCYRQNKNQGAAVARNKALELSKGRYIAFLDSDDLWKVHKIQVQLDLMRKKNIGFLFSAIDMINEEGEIIKSKRKVIDKINYNYLLKNTMIATSTVIVDRIKLGDFKMPLIRSGQDYATWLKLLKIEDAYGINEVLVSYRIRKGSLSSNKFKSLKQVYYIQTNLEEISKINAVFNCFCFVINALKKYFL